MRRRRAVLIALVLSSLILLTAYFGESSGGGLHGVQRTAMSVLSPIQEGANRAVKPARDLFGWFGDTFDAKHQRDQLRAERDRLRTEVGELSVQNSEIRQRAGLAAQNGAGGMRRYSPVEASVYQRSPSTWDQTVLINKGSNDGIKIDQPVLNRAGLVGRVEDVTGGSAQVMLITDPDFGVSAKVAKTQEPGTIGPVEGTPGDLLFDNVSNPQDVHKDDLIITAGTTTQRLRSPFPPGIVIGNVSRVELGDGPLDRRIHVRPAADLRRLDLVEVLVNPQANLTAEVR